MKLFRLHLRDLFSLIVAVAIGLGWWLDRTRFHKRIATAESEVAHKLEMRIAIHHLTQKIQQELGKTRVGKTRTYRSSIRAPEAE
jgi:hypothetical protein